MVLMATLLIIVFLSLHLHKCSQVSCSRLQLAQVKSLNKSYRMSFSFSTAGSSAVNLLLNEGGIGSTVISVLDGESIFPIDISITSFVSNFFVSIKI